MLQITFRNFDDKKDIERLYAYITKRENQIYFPNNVLTHIDSLNKFNRWISDKLGTYKYKSFSMIENTEGQTIGFLFSSEFFNKTDNEYTLCLYEEFQNLGPQVIQILK